jgi:hypothetical protein
VICVVSMDWIYICSLSLHVLIVFTYAHCLYICHVVNDVTFDFILITTEFMLCCQWCCFVLNFCQFWSYALVPIKFWMLHNISTCTVFVFSALFGLWWNCQLQKLFGIWADDLKLVRNLASLPAVPTVFVDMLTVFMMPLCSKFLIKWWLTWSETYCLYRYAHCFYRYSLCLYMVTVFIYAHYLYIYSLS